MNGQTRFSPAAVAAYVAERRARLEADYGFTDQDGWKQVAYRSKEVNRAYGEYIALEDLLDAFDIRQGARA